MSLSKIILACDLGTTGIKTCIFEVGENHLELIDAEMASYPLQILENGGAEQEPELWWEAMCRTTTGLLKKTGLDPESISGISFCSQMQALVLIDRQGKTLRPAMIYMDQRAGIEMKKAMGHGLTIAGINIFKLLISIRETGAVSASVKDPVFRYLWVKANEPEIFQNVYRWLDAKEYLIGRMTGRWIMTEDSAFATLLYDTRKRSLGWSKKVCAMLDVNLNHLPEIMLSTDKVGPLSNEAAEKLGLHPGTPVFGGGGDASLIGIGAGAINPGDTHIYTGTSGWVSTVVEKQMIDLGTIVAAIIGANPSSFNYFAEMETAGKCLEWVRDNLALDLLGIYDKPSLYCESTEATYKNIYAHLTGLAAQVPAGSRGVIFTPWLHGNRCPFEDSKARGIFFNLGLETGKSEMIRAVIEGVCYHLRWMLEAQDRKITTSKTIRYAGGGALSETTCQVLADVTGRTVETIKEPQNAGSVGAALVAGLGLGVIDSFEAVKEIVKPSKVFKAQAINKPIYDRGFAVYKQLYRSNRKHFEKLNADK